ncbi:MAG: Mov34/MPN/PAD-1 family protein [Planctomycetota bacterium]|jgi:proteasome lid subunit RPN8/RPN11
MSSLDTRAIEVAELRHESPPEVCHDFRVFISEAAFDRATERGHAEPGREVGGVLVGELCKDEGGAYIRVDTTIDALHADQKTTELTFTHATWEHIHGEMDTKHEGKRILGWYHTHPGFGIFLSDRDLFIQRSFFNLPYQIALVYDPKSREHGVFAWRDNEPKRSRRHWIGGSEHIWDGVPPPTASKDPAPERADAPAERRARDGDEPDRFFLYAIGVALLIVGGLIGWWFGARDAAAVVERAQQRADAERLAGAEQAIRSLNLELLALLRESLGGEAIRRPLDESLAALEEGNLDRARSLLTGLRDSHAAAEATLSALAEAAQSGTVSPHELERRLAVQQAVLGQLCAEMAAQARDAAVARRLLRDAARVDPAKREYYARKLRALEEAR